MELQCQLCKRPFRKPNLGLYNVPNLGAVCCDCIDNINKVEELPLTIGNYNKVANAVKTRLKYAFKEIEVCCNPKYYHPFQIIIKQTETSSISIGFQNLDQLKFLHKVLGKFIDNCEVDYNHSSSIKCKEV